jgi:hypothetical protein
MSASASVMSKQGGRVTAALTLYPDRRMPVRIAIDSLHLVHLLSVAFFLKAMKCSDAISGHTVTISSL